MMTICLFLAMKSFSHLEICFLFAAVSISTRLPAPAAVIQRAVADFISEGHFLRHLRRMKRLYSARRDGVLAALREVAPAGCAVRQGGLAVLLDLPEGIDDLDIAKRAVLRGMSPVPLSPWRSEKLRPGLMLGITNVPTERARELCERLVALVS